MEANLAFVKPIEGNNKKKGKQQSTKGMHLKPHFKVIQITHSKEKTMSKRIKRNKYHVNSFV